MSTIAKSSAHEDDENIADFGLENEGEVTDEETCLLLVLKLLLALSKLHPFPATIVGERGDDCEDEL